MKMVKVFSLKEATVLADCHGKRSRIFIKTDLEFVVIVFWYCTCPINNKDVF